MLTHRGGERYGKHACYTYTVRWCFLALEHKQVKRAEGKTRTPECNIIFVSVIRPSSNANKPWFLPSIRSFFGAFCPHKLSVPRRWRVYESIDFQFDVNCCVRKGKGKKRQDFLRTTAAADQNYSCSMNVLSNRVYRKFALQPASALRQCKRS